MKKEILNGYSHHISDLVTQLGELQQLSIALKDFTVPEDDRVAFAKFYAYLAQSDHEVSLQEKHSLDDLLFAWGLSEPDVLEVYSVIEHGAVVAELAAQIRNKKTTYLLVQELVTLAMLDENYSEAEKRAVRTIASACDVSLERVESIEQWVSDGIDWRRRGVELLHTEES